MNFSKLKNCYILIADDSFINISLLSFIFRKWELRFDTAADGEIAFNMFLENDYTLVITDIEMPNMNGIELLQAIRSVDESKKRRTPVVAITAHQSEERHREYFDAGMDDVAVRPYNQENLYQLLEKYI